MTSYHVYVNYVFISISCKRLVRTTVFCVLAMVQVSPRPTLSAAATDGPAAGAEFLKNVIGNLPKVTRKINNDRIDVEEYIPDDVPPYANHVNEIQMLSKLPSNYVNENSFYFPLAYFFSFFIYI